MTQARVDARARTPLAGLALSVAALACGCARRPEPAPVGVGAGRFTVMTYNVNYGMPTPGESTRAIRQADADIVCLQETNPGWREVLELRLAKAYPHRRYLPSRGGGGGMAVLSKYPLAGMSVLQPPKGGWFPAWLVEVDTPGGSVQLLCVHLRPALSEAGSVGLGPLLTSAGVRKREIVRHAGRLGVNRPAIVLGDLNEGDGGGAVGWLRKQGFTDALAKYDAWSPTWVWPTPLLTLRERLDHILYSRHLRCTAARVLRQGGSDHYPVVATFRLGSDSDENARPKHGR